MHNEQRVKSFPSAKSNEQRAENNEQRAKSNEQRATNKNFSLQNDKPQVLQTSKGCKI